MVPLHPKDARESPDTTAMGGGCGVNLNPTCRGVDTRRALDSYANATHAYGLWGVHWTHTQCQTPLTLRESQATRAESLRKHSCPAETRATRRVSESIPAPQRLLPSCDAASQSVTLRGTESIPHTPRCMYHASWYSCPSTSTRIGYLVHANCPSTSTRIGYLVHASSYSL